MAKEVIVNLDVKVEDLAGLVLANFARSSALIAVLQDRGILNDDAVKEIYREAIDVLSKVAEAGGPTQNQTAAKWAADFLRTTGPLADA